MLCRFPADYYTIGCNSTVYSARKAVEGFTKRKYAPFKCRRQSQTIPITHFGQSSFAESLMLHIFPPLFYSEMKLALREKAQSACTMCPICKNSYSNVASNVQHKLGINIWAGSLGDHILGSYLLPESFNGVLCFPTARPLGFDRRNTNYSAPKHASHA